MGNGTYIGLEIIHALVKCIFLVNSCLHVVFSKVKHFGRFNDILFFMVILYRTIFLNRNVCRSSLKIYILQ